MATPLVPPRPPRTPLERLLAPGALTMATWILGVVALGLAWEHRAAGFICGVAAIILGTAALWRGRVLGRRRAATLQAALDAAASRNHELEALRHLAQVLLTGESLPQLLTEVCRFAAELLDGEAAGLGLGVEEGRFIRIAAGTGLMEHAVDRMVPTDRSLAGWVVSHGESIVVDDMSADARNFEFTDTPRELRSAAWTPLRTGGLVIGVIGVFNHRGGGTFTEEHLERLRTLADQAALGFDRAHMHEESQRTAHELARKNVELQRATKLKNEFLANVSHELRTPLNAIIGFSELLLTGDLGAVRSEHKDFLESIHRNGRHLL
ncbi:MAG TPA: GAF domain-containing protein, partial [Gemmatimonadales bacterium]|nr:GAF domain-containing protein [Gemmatimonadales bacterium]